MFFEWDFRRGGIVGGGNWVGNLTSFSVYSLYICFGLKFKPSSWYFIPSFELVVSLRNNFNRGCVLEGVEFFLFNLRIFKEGLGCCFKILKDNRLRLREGYSDKGVGSIFPILAINLGNFIIAFRALIPSVYIKNNSWYCALQCTISLIRSIANPTAN